jgi:hypothetical protein
MRRPLLCLAVWLLMPPGRAGAYVDHMGGFTLGYVVKNAATIVVLEVESVSLEKRVVIFKKVADLKGRHPGKRVKHQLKEGLQPHELKTVLDWAAPGRVAVCFHDGKVGTACASPTGDRTGSCGATSRRCWPARRWSSRRCGATRRTPAPARPSSTTCRAARALPALIEALKGAADSSLRLYAAHAPGAIGPRAAGAVVALTRALKDRDESARQAAGEALRKVRRG